MSAPAAPKPIDAGAIGRAGGAALRRAIKGESDDDHEQLASWLFSEEDTAAEFRLKTILTLHGLATAARHFEKRIAEQRDQIAALIERQQAQDARVATLESELREREFKGTWDQTKTYQRGNTVQRSGCTWHSNVNENRSKPGEHPTAWTLQAKAGRDGRDGKDARS